MSIPVDLANLGRALEGFRAGYLLTTSTEGRVKVVTAEPSAADDGLVVSGPGRGTLGNLAANSAVTLVFPPLEPRGFTLLVDGTGVAVGDDVRITPTGAVLHRPAAHSDGPPAPDGCGHDCHPLT